VYEPGGKGVGETGKVFFGKTAKFYWQQPEMKKRIILYIFVLVGFKKRKNGTYSIQRDKVPEIQAFVLIIRW